MPSIVKLVCDGCGKIHEHDKDKWEDEPEGWRESCGGHFCPDCWKTHLEVVRGYIEDFGKRLTIPLVHEDNRLMVASLVMQNALDDLRQARNPWGTLPRKEEEWQADGA